MASFVFNDGKAVINAVDLSSKCRGVDVQLSTKKVDDTTMGQTGTVNKPSLTSWKMTLTFVQDFAAASVDATVFPLWSGRSTFTVSVRPTSAAASATNPDLSGTAMVTAYNPLSGNVGDEPLCKVELDCAGAISHT